jgi:hypothetical protein
MVKTIIVHNNEYLERDIAYDKLNQYKWSIYKNFVMPGLELYYIQPLDYDIKNELATKLIHAEVVGSLIFVKVSHTSIVNIDINDLPELPDMIDASSLMIGFKSIALESHKTSSITRVVPTRDDAEIISLSNKQYYADVSKTPSTPSTPKTPDSDFMSSDDYQAMCVDDEYYNYHAGYDSY